MKDTLKPGMFFEKTITTTPDMGISHMGPNVPSMFSTPSMIMLMEGSCVEFLTPHMGEGEQTVGFHVDVKHLAPTKIGQNVRAKVTLNEIKGRRLLLTVEAFNEDGTKVGDGTHERAVVDISRFAGQ
ncbi:MAG: thioesterase family protein [Deltaproteobacteria bacterium]|nr:thioesterase family protein [Deltaproteobacteria bacterium]